MNLRLIDHDALAIVPPAMTISQARPSIGIAAAPIN